MTHHLKVEHAALAMERRSTTKHKHVGHNGANPKRRGRKPNMKAYFAANLAKRGHISTKEKELSKLIPQAREFISAAERTRNYNEKIRLYNKALGLMCLGMDERAAIARKIEGLGGTVL